jgi:rRNA processing protein Gar1
MNALVGDTIHIHARTVGAQDRIGTVVEIHGPDGEPPYLVRFEDGHEGLIFPGPDCVVEHVSRHAPNVGA